MLAKITYEHCFDKLQGLFDEQVKPIKKRQTMNIYVIIFQIKK